MKTARKKKTLNELTSSVKRQGPPDWVQKTESNYLMFTGYNLSLEWNKGALFSEMHIYISSYKEALGSKKKKWAKTKPSK